MVSFALVEAGLPAPCRQRDQPQSIIRGVGGAGLYSDGKFSFYRSASALWSLADPVALQEAYAWLSEILKDEGIDVPPLPLDRVAAERRHRREPWSKFYPSHYLPIPSRERMVRRLADEVGPALKTTAHVIGIRKTHDAFLLYAETNRGLCTQSARAVIFAGGRFGPLEFARLMPDAPMVFRRYEIGVRLEQPSDRFVFREHPSLDVKEIAPGPINDSEWRTFCTCRYGEVIETLWNHSRAYSARADGAPTTRSSFGLNLRFASPPTKLPLEEEIWNVLTGQISPFRVPLTDFLKSSRIFFGALLDEFFRTRLAEMLPVELHDLSVVYGPCIEGVGYYPDVNDVLKLNSHEIWVAGDACGTFRGLTAALVSGYFCGRKVHNFLSASQHMPHFVKDSPSQPMPVAFTAQSKALFYCRDAVCEFVLRRGFLPLNPFRVFGYFLSDRVERDLVRQANNQLIAVADELWVFGPVSDGVLFEIVRARNFRKPVRFFTIATRSEDIRAVGPRDVRFEPEVHAFQIKREDLLALLADAMPVEHTDNKLAQLALDLE